MSRGPPLNTVINLWIAAPVFGGALVLQWAVLRTKYRNGLTKQRARHVQQQQTASGHLEQAKRQIGQLQDALAAARRQVKQHTMDGAASLQSRSRAKEALQRTLDDASALRRRLPPDGFADTLPSLQFPHDVGLLLR